MMIAPTQSHSLETKHASEPRLATTAVSLFVGVVFGALFVWLGGALPTAALFALFLMGIALAFVGTTLVETRFRKNSRLRWDLLFAGQIIGAAGAIIFFFTSVG